MSHHHDLCDDCCKAHCVCHGSPPARQADRERAARECVLIENRGDRFAVILRFPGTRTYEFSSELEAVEEREWWIAWLLDKIASREAAVLEEAAKELDGWNWYGYENGLHAFQQWLRQQVKERGA